MRFKTRPPYKHVFKQRQLTLCSMKSQASSLLSSSSLTVRRPQMGRALGLPAASLCPQRLAQALTDRHSRHVS